LKTKNRLAQKIPMRKALSMVALATLLSACQTAPKNLASIKDDQAPDQARIMVTPMLVSGASGDAAFAMLFGGGTTPFAAALYDATDAEPRLIGFIGGSARSLYDQPLIAYDAPPGKRVVMLVMPKAFGGYHVDFAEVNVAAGQIGFIAISQFGALDRPYLKTVDLDTSFLKSCVYQRNLDESQIISRNRALGLLESKGRTSLCGHLSRNTIQNQEKLDSPRMESRFRINLPSREAAVEMKNKLYPKWLILTPKIGSYDLD
jgi:hypothetical protein